MSGAELKYNYIIAGGPGFYEFAYRDIARLPGVKYYQNYVDGIDGPLWKLLARINFNLRVNALLPAPLRRLVFPRLFKMNGDTRRPLCFIFFGTQFAVINTAYPEYLRKRFPGVRLVLFMQDIVSSLPYYHINDYKKRFDLVLSYDKGDCSRYGLAHYPTPFSVATPHCGKSDHKADVYFCGKAKTRYTIILEVYRKCRAAGLKCLFFISGLPSDKRIEGEGLIYDTPISYEENIAYASQCRCILEVMQENADGFTPRLWEALAYDKHLLTDSASVADPLYNDAGNLHTLKEVDSILQWIDTPVKVSSRVKESLSPLNLLHFIESELSASHVTC